MYPLALTAHSYLRLALLALLVIAVLRSVRGWMGSKAYAAPERKLGLILTIVTDLQLLLGLLLYFVWSPVVQAARADMGASMKDPIARFWAVEHVSAMLLAVVLVHVGKILARKARTDSARHGRAALWWGMALVIFVALSPWPWSKVERPIARTAVEGN